MVKRYLTIFLITTICLSTFTGCGSAQNSSKVDKSAASSQSGKLFDKPVTLSLMIPSSPGFSFNEDWYILKALQEKTNVTLNVDAVYDNNGGFATKLNLVMASGNIPDLIYPIGDAVTKQYGDQGAFVDAYDKTSLDQTPNFKKWAEANKNYVKDFISSDGKLFMYPEKGIEEANRRGWLYREDIFKKNNLAIPKNENDLYAVLKKLKELYPNSYPLAFRNGISELSMLAPSWNTDYQMYYKPKAKGFVYGPIEDNFKDMITFYNKLYKEKLIPPNILTLDTKGWQDVMSNSDSFITVDYLSRIDFFNVPMRKTDPNFSLTYMPPMKGGANGVDKFASTSVGTYGFVVSSKSKQRDNALKYVDWFYTQKAAELTSWGEEGKTYNVVDGKKKFIGNSIDVTSLRNNTGLSTWGFYQLFDYDAHISLFSKEVASAYDQSRKDDLPSNTILSFTPQEQEVVNSIGVNIQKATDEQISKFILGTRDLNEWDQYVKEIKALGLDKLKDVYAKAYARKQAVNK